MDVGQELLREYAQAGSQQAFRRIVELYVDFVYATAKRQVHDQHVAEDVAQTVSGCWQNEDPDMSAPYQQPLIAVSFSRPPVSE